MCDKEVERELTLWAAKQPRTEEAQLMLKAAEAIARLRGRLRYEQARADINAHADELKDLRQLCCTAMATVAGTMSLDELSKECAKFVR